MFQIRNRVNGKLYVGSSLNLDAIWNRNRMELKLSGHRNPALQEDWKKFGEDNFVFEILSEIEQKDGDKTDYTKEVRELEKLFMDELQPFGEVGYHQEKG